MVKAIMPALALAAGVTAAAAITSAGAQTPAPPPAPGLTGQSHPEDVVYGRRLMMALLGRHMDHLARMALPGAEFHADIAEESLLSTAYILQGFPHLFPPETDTMPPEDEIGNLSSTNARPAIWENFDDFYARTQEASDIALRALSTEPGPEFVQAVERLQRACDSCHQDYRRTRSTYAIPIPPLQ